MLTREELDSGYLAQNLIDKDYDLTTSVSVYTLLTSTSRLQQFQEWFLSAFNNFVTSEPFSRLFTLGHCFPGFPPRVLCALSYYRPGTA